MKKTTLIVFKGILICALYSCTPENIIDSTEDVQACCGNEGTIELPPPPSDGTGD